MDIKVTPSGGSTDTLCMLPEQIKFGGQAKFMSYSIISLGDVKVPRGSALDEISWSGKFPGSKRKNEPYVKTEFWKEPKTMVKYFRNLRDKGTKLNLTITGTGINMDMYVSSFDGKFTGGHGDFDYEIKFVKAVTIQITASQSTTSQAKPTVPTNTKPRDESATKKKNTQNTGSKSGTTYTIVHGDTMWRIATKYLGDGSRWPEIYKKNKAVLDAEAKKHGYKDASPGYIWSGIKITIPAK